MRFRKHNFIPLRFGFFESYLVEKRVLVKNTTLQVYSKSKETYTGLFPLLAQLTYGKERSW